MPAAVALMPAAVALMLALCGCVDLSTARVDEDGVYRFEKDPISVRAPQDCLEDMAAFRGDRRVDFTTGRRYWKAMGQYFVIVFQFPASVDASARFVGQSKAFFEEFRAQESKNFDLDLALIEQREMEVNGDQAYRVLFEDSGKGTLVATARLHSTRVTIAALLFPLQEGQSPAEQIPWECYERFVTSVTEQREKQ